MACKLTCPKCLLVLKEEGDNSKIAQAEYRVYTNESALKFPKNSCTLIMCLSCHHIGIPRDFDDPIIGDYIKNYKMLKRFLTDEETLTPVQIKNCLISLLGHEVIELIKDHQQPLSLSDIKTDLNYLFNFGFFKLDK